MVQEGRRCGEADEPLLELETDKVTVEVPSPADGAIESISAQAGATVQVGACWAPSPKARRRAAAAAKPRRPKAEAPKTRAPQPPHRRSDAPAMPSAKRISEKSASPVSVAGTGKDGRVTKGDMLGALAARPRRPGARAAARRPAPNEAREERVPMTRLRKTIALRLKESQNTAAQLTTFNEVDMTR
jgi:2-oxoglutarate dehydrogenase E2 component (dihydrolipoamide succinyltransferase)